MLANITEFLPYFYIAVPRGFTNEDIEPFRSHLNVSANGPPVMLLG